MANIGKKLNSMFERYVPSGYFDDPKNVYKFIDDMITVYGVTINHYGFKDRTEINESGVNAKIKRADEMRESLGFGSRQQVPDEAFLEEAYNLLCEINSISMGMENNSAKIQKDLAMVGSQNPIVNKVVKHFPKLWEHLEPEPKVLSVEDSLAQEGVEIGEGETVNITEEQVAQPATQDSKKIIQEWLSKDSRFTEILNNPDASLKLLSEMTSVYSRAVNLWGYKDERAIKDSGVNEVLKKYAEVEEKMIYDYSQRTDDQLAEAFGLCYEIGARIRTLPQDERNRVLEGIEKVGGSFSYLTREALSIIEDNTEQNMSTFTNETHETVNRTTQEEETPEERNA